MNAPLRASSLRYGHSFVKCALGLQMVHESTIKPWEPVSKIPIKLGVSELNWTDPMETG
jgi:hypothetical protein